MALYLPCSLLRNNEKAKYIEENKCIDRTKLGNVILWKLLNIYIYIRSVKVNCRIITRNVKEIMCSYGGIDADIVGAKCVISLQFAFCITELS